jgi:hypothetical protein
MIAVSYMEKNRPTPNRSIFINPLGLQIITYLSHIIHSFLIIHLKIVDVSMPFVIPSTEFACFFVWFVRLLALRPLLAYCASLG